MAKVHSITDVARAAGVSATTVSHAISGKRAVSESTRLRIYEAIERLDYRPNLVAKSLRSRKTNSVALVVADIANPFYPAVARGIHDELSPRGYVSIIGNTDGDGDGERALLREMVARSVDGIIMQPAALPMTEVRAIVGSVPLVVIASETGELLADQVSTDDGHGIAEAISYLRQRGFSSVGCVSGPEFETQGPTRLITPGIVRLSAVRAAAGTAGMELREEWIEHAAYTRDGGFVAASRILARPDRPQVIMCSNDMVAFGVMDAARSAGLSIPGDVGVVGFDDVDTADLVFPRLTTILNPATLMGSTCAASLLRRMQSGPDAPYEHTMLPTHLVVRESV